MQNIHLMKVGFYFQTTEGVSKEYSNSVTVSGGGQMVTIDNYGQRGDLDPYKMKM